MYVHSYAFALEETNEREKAEKLLKKVLNMNPKIPWAHHAMSKAGIRIIVSKFNSCCLAHVLEESHDAGDGVDFLTQTRSDWDKSVFGGHITWHLTLHYFGMIRTYIYSILQWWCTYMHVTYLL